jgi:hypothetical protein
VDFFLFSWTEDIVSGSLEWMLNECESGARDPSICRELALEFGATKRGVGRPITGKERLLQQTAHGGIDFWWASKYPEERTYHMLATQISRNTAMHDNIWIFDKHRAI